MSVYWARGGGDVPELTHGFFDADSEIALLWSNEPPIEPLVVVEHELAHVNITQNSTIGLIENALTALHLFLGRRELHTADEPRLQRIMDLRMLCLDRLVEIRRAAGEVHEAVAWLGTEELTAGREDLRAPRAYEPLVFSIRKGLSRVVGFPPSGSEEYFQAAMHLAEALAINALSSSDSHSLLAAATQHVDDGVSALRKLLARRNVEPRRRFDDALSALSRLRKSDASDWADSMFHPSHGATESAGRSSDKMPTTVGPKDLREAIPGALFNLAGDVMPNRSAAMDELARFWYSYLDEGRFRRSADRYSQTAVLGARLLAGALQPVSSKQWTEEPPADFLLSSVVLVTRATSTEDERSGWQQPTRSPGEVALFSVRIGSHFPWLGETGVSISRWVTTVRAAWRYLHGVVGPANQPIVVVNVGYDEQSGDFEDAPLVGDLTHVVVRSGSFRNLWRHIALREPAGFAGSRSLEWLPMRSPGYPTGPFGYIVIKPSSGPTPILLLPTCIGRVDRVMSVVEAEPSPYGVTLSMAATDPLSWLGTSSKLPSAAAQCFEALAL